MTASEKRRVALIVEDEMITSALLKSRLTTFGFHVLEQATTGERACELAREGAPDLVMMDIDLAGAIDGIEAAEIINHERHTPVCFVTGLPRADLSELHDRPYVVGIVEKPFRIDRLESVVNRL